MNQVTLFQSIFLLATLGATCLFSAGCTGSNAELDPSFSKAVKAFNFGRYSDAIELLKPLANAGDAKGMHLLWACYVSNSSAADSQKAAAWKAKALPELEKLSSENDTLASYYLAHELTHSKVRPEEAKQLFKLALAEFEKEAEEATDPMLLQRIGAMYANGLGAEKNYTKAAVWLRKAADAGIPIAKVTLAEMYVRGEGFEKNAEQAVKLFREASDAGHPIGHYRFGQMLVNGMGTPKDLATGLSYFEKAAEQGHAESIGLVFQMYDGGIGTEKNSKVASEWLVKSANRGNSHGQFVLASKYLQGIDEFEENYQEALEWCRRSTKQGNSNADFLMGIMYGQGLGVPHDNKQSFEWLRKSAEKGNATGQFYLGNSYAMGNGVPIDKAEAAKWYLKASENGNKAAKEKLKNLFNAPQAQSPQSTALARRTPTSRKLDSHREVKSFAKRLAKAFGKQLMEAIGGGQDLVVNVNSVDFDEDEGLYEIDIAVSFNGQVFRADNYQVTGRIFVKSDGTGGRFARTGANANYTEWEGLLKGVVITAALVEAYNEANSNR